MGTDVPFIEYAEVNPKRNLRRGAQYPFVEMNAVPEGGGEPAYFTEREYDGGGGSRFAVGDTLFARITPCTENGKIAYVAGLNGSDAAFGSTELIVLSARVGKAEPRFIYQVAASQRVRRRAVSRMLGTSGRQRVPTWFFTEELTVLAFTMPEQRAIAAVLDAIDDAIERTEAVIAATERLREALLHELLTRGVPGWHSEWKHVPGLGTVPACWEVVRLGEVADVRSGQADPRDKALQQLLFVAPDDVESATGRLITRRTVADANAISGKYEFDGRDVIYSKIRPYLMKVYVPSERGLCSADMYPIRPRRGLDRGYLALVLLSARFTEYARTCSDRTGIPKINRQDLLRFQLAFPSDREQQRIAELETTLQAQWDAGAQQLMHLRELKAALAEALLSGRVRMPQQEAGPK